MISVLGMPKCAVIADRLAFERWVQKLASEAASAMAKNVDREILDSMCGEAQHDDAVMNLGLSDRFGPSAKKNEAERFSAAALANAPNAISNDALNISENDEEWQSTEGSTVSPTMQAVLWGAFGDGECEVELDEFGEAVEWDGTVPEPFLSKDPDTVFTVLRHYYDLLDAINHPSNKTGSTKIMLQCDDCKHGPCDVTNGIDDTFYCHTGKEKREDGFYVGKFR